MTPGRGPELVLEQSRSGEPDQGGIEAIHKRFREAGRRFGYPERTTQPFTVSLGVYQLTVQNLLVMKHATELVGL